MHPSSSSGSALKMLVDLIQERLGLRYENNRLDILADRLEVRITEGNFPSLLDYYYYLRYDEQSGDEWRRLQSQRPLAR